MTLDVANSLNIVSIWIQNKRGIVVRMVVRTYTRRSVMKAARH